MPAKDRSKPEDSLPTPDPAADTDLAAQEGLEADAEEEAGKTLTLEVAIDRRGACERHVTVTVSREDIQEYFEEQFTELMTEAEVPGFRKGHTPRKVVESRFRKDVGEKVKSALVADSIAQVTKDEELSAISDPQLDVDAVKLPDAGPMTFEFDLEVRPEFEVPQWKGLKISRPVRTFSREDVDEQLLGLLARYGRLVPHEGPAAVGDYLTANLTFKHGDEVLASAEEETIRIRPVLSFRDGRIEKFDKLMKGVKAQETRQGEAQLSEDAPNVALRGKKVTAIFEVLEVKKLEIPELTPQFLEEMGGFGSEAELRDAVKDSLQRRLEYRQHQRAREQVTAALTEAADWELPPAMLERQSRRELQRAILELRRSGFSDEEIRAHENALRQNSRAATGRALKEHFILERIAEDESIDVDEADYQAEIAIVASQSGESARRVRSRLEKGGMMDALHNQIVERKVIKLILDHAEFKDAAYELEAADTEALDHSAGGADQPDIPEAKSEGPDKESEKEPEAT